MTETAEIVAEPVATEDVGGAVRRLLEDMPRHMIGEFVRATDVVDWLLDLQQISKN